MFPKQVSVQNGPDERLRLSTWKRPSTRASAAWPRDEDLSNALASPAQSPSRSRLSTFELKLLVTPRKCTRMYRDLKILVRWNHSHSAFAGANSGCIAPIGARIQLDS